MRWGIQAALGMLLAPLLLGVITRTKAFFAGRCGAPLLQPYYDLAKLLGKGAVYSRTTSWVFRAGPVVGLAAMLMALAFMPAGGAVSPFAFAGDMLFVAGLLGLTRFFTILAALDTGSAFEGMGASREAQFSALAEPALLLGLAVLAKQSGELSLSGVMQGISASSWGVVGPELVLVSAALLIVFLTENARIPVDDPNTHLELTMIHEVMVLDHGGPDFAFILYGSAIKLWILGTLLVGLLVPVRTGNAWIDGGAFAGGMLALSVTTGVIESTMARLRLVRVPHLLVGAIALSTLALILVLR
ncbi:MAG: NADH-quinone oxidoreductase subunit H [Planctomycetes bacterium]|nr:NADH-quinone oxidoreductase subunit H [Planctomycetota bacterium]